MGEVARKEVDVSVIVEVAPCCADGVPPGEPRAPKVLGPRMGMAPWGRSFALFPALLFSILKLMSFLMGSGPHFGPKIEQESTQNEYKIVSESLPFSILVFSSIPYFPEF